MLSLADLLKIIAEFEASAWRTIELKGEGLDLYLSKDGHPRPAASATATAAPVSAARPEAAAVSAPPLDADAAPPGWIVVRAPSLGTFYRSPRPGAPPLAEIGQRVAAGDGLCLIEVMKLFTTLQSPAAGIVREVRAADGDLVEHDQPLFLLEPA